MMRALRIGDRVACYKITAMSPDSVMAKAITKCTVHTYVVYDLSYDRCAVHNPKPFDNHADACEEFALRIRLETS
jgi:hypothetical protein